MTLDVYFKEDIRNALSSTISMAVTTSQAAIQAGGKIDEGYMFGVLSAQRSNAKAFGLPWCQVVYDALCDIEALAGIVAGIEALANKPLSSLVYEIERKLLGRL